MNTRILENDLLDKIGRHFNHPASQLNALHESDAELIRLNGDDKSILAITTDTIIEEISLGLYDDPYQAGWMIVMVNLSDLAAVGATPIGLLLSESLPENSSEAFIDAVQQGAADACRKCHTYILGGDTNFGNQFILSGTAIGRITGTVVKRIGCRPGDILFSSGPLGTGNSYVLNKLLHPNSQPIFMPTARMEEGVCAAAYASAIMDTSDGVLATLDQIMRLNQTGFLLNETWRHSLDSAAISTARSLSIPEWLLLAGNHGEYELLFTVPQTKSEPFLASAKKIDWTPLSLGVVTAEPKIDFSTDDGHRTIDTAYIRNIFLMKPFSIETSIIKLLEYSHLAGLEG